MKINVQKKKMVLELAEDGHSQKNSKKQCVEAGLLARPRKEVLKLNEQLRYINAALRRQGKIESYAPVSGRVAENEVIIDLRKQDLIASPYQWEKLHKKSRS